MEKANDMITNDTMTCWYALHTAPKLEHKLMQRLNAAGYSTFCPMQAVFVKWNGKTKEVIVPLFSGCLFVAGDVTKIASLITSQKAAVIVGKEGEKLTIEADKTELLTKFIQLLKE